MWESTFSKVTTSYMYYFLVTRSIDLCKNTMFSSILYPCSTLVLFCKLCSLVPCHLVWLVSSSSLDVSRVPFGPLPSITSCIAVPAIARPPLGYLLGAFCLQMLPWCVLIRAATQLLEWFHLGEWFWLLASWPCMAWWLSDNDALDQFCSIGLCQIWFLSNAGVCRRKLPNCATGFGAVSSAPWGLHKNTKRDQIASQCRRPCTWKTKSDVLWQKIKHPVSLWNSSKNI